MSQQPSALELRSQALHLLDDAIQKPPAELKAEVDVAEQRIARLRDVLIDDLRAGSTPDTRAALDQVNVALTLVVGLEYPMGGLQRKMLEDARAVLDAVTLPPPR
ncbi:MAG: hypothetical protein JO352_31480 [Chloroflexi bacterium]|nr:hypothetical protein [Chloroflexota bacterium]MBV9597422.1 hypothetical protein [Chloroflexota bacterium]